MAKLKHEQHVRVHLEQQYFEAMEKLQTMEEKVNPDTTTNAFSSPSSFGKFFGSSSPVSKSTEVAKTPPRPAAGNAGSGGGWSKFAMGTAVSLFKDMTSNNNGPSGASGDNKHLQTLCTQQTKQIQGKR